METTLPQYGRLVRAPALVEMQFKCMLKLGNYKLAKSCSTRKGTSSGSVGKPDHAALLSAAALLAEASFRR